MSQDKIEIVEGSDESEIEESGSSSSDEDSAMPEKPTMVEAAHAVSFHNAPRKEPKQKRAKKVKSLTKKEHSIKVALKQEKDLWGLVKPDITKDRERERMLRRIATQGVVQLFNAVSERQKLLDEVLESKVKDKKLLVGEDFKVGGKGTKSKGSANKKENVEKMETDENLLKEEPMGIVEFD